MAAQPDENLLELLQCMLTPIRRARDTPLQFEIDSAAIAKAALADFPSIAPDGASGRREDWEPVTAALDALVARMLDDETPVAPSPSDPRFAANAVRCVEAGSAAAGNGNHPLADWLKRLFLVLRKVDHRAFEILGRRMEGLQDREIAAQLDLGLRLVRRIVRDMGASWASEPSKK